MKAARTVLKIAAVLAAVGAAVWAVVTYWDEIVEGVHRLRGKLAEKCPCCCPAEYDDFADLDDWDY